MMDLSLKELFFNKSEKTDNISIETFRQGNEFESGSENTILMI